MSWLDSALSHGVRHEEEVESAVDDFGLLHESVVDIGTLGRVSDGSVRARADLEEPLSHALVHDDEGVLRARLLLARVETVLLVDNFLELFKLVIDHLLSHGVADTITVNENVIRQLAVVVISERLERALEVALENARADDFLSFLALRACLGIVFTHVLIIRRTEANDALLALVANIDADQHGLSRDLCPEVQAPQISSELCVDLPQDIDVYSVIVFLDRLARDKLRDHWTVCVDLVFQRGVKVLLLDRVRHNDEEKVKVLRLPWLRKLSSVGVSAANILQVVVINCLLECFDARLVAQLDDVAIVHVNVKPSFLREFVESIVQVLAMLDVLLEAEDGPLPEVHRLVNNGSQDLHVVERLRRHLVGHLLWRVDLWPFQHPGFDCVRLKLDVQIPLFYFFRLRNHRVQLFDASDSFWRLLEQTLPDLGHHFLALSDLGRNANQSAELGW